MNAARTMLLAAIALATACTQELGTEGQTPASGSADNANLGPGSIATVNGVPIPESLFRYYALTTQQTDADSLSAAEREAILDEVVELRLLADAALADRLHEERTIAAELELVRLQRLARAAAVRFMEQNPATEAELRAKYEEILPSLATDQYKARHILLDSEAEAAAVIDELDAGGDFAALARERSTGPTGPNGGELDWFSSGAMVEPFDRAVRAMSTGEYSAEPVQTQYGWHVILLEDVRESQPPGLDSVRTELTNVVEREKLAAYIAGLREGAEIAADANQ